MYDWKDQFLAIEADCYPELPDIHCKGMLYAPGLVCYNCGMTLKLGFVVKNGFEDGVYGRECVHADEIAPWLSLMQRARYHLFVQQLERDEKLKPAERKYFRGLSLITQLKPWSDFARGMYARLMDGNLLTSKQTEVVNSMIVSEGGLASLLFQRDLIRCLLILEKALEYESEDQEHTAIVKSLLLRTSRHPLSTKQNRLIKAIEAQHINSRTLMSSKIVEQWPLPDGKVNWSK